MRKLFLLLFVLLFCSVGFGQGSGYTFISIDVPFTGASNTRANGINDRGDIVGRYEDGTGVHGFLLSQGTFSVISVPGAPADEEGPARGINARGDIVGHFFDSNGEHGFLL